MNDKSDHPKTLLAIHQGAIGDFLLALSVIKAVREGLGLQRIEVIADTPSARLSATIGAIDICHDTHSVSLYTLFDPDESIAPRLIERLAQADHVVSFLSSIEHDLHRRLANATDTPVASVDPRPAPDTLQHRQHITNQWRNHLGKQGPSIPTPTRLCLRVHGVGQGIVIHPGSGGMTKCWPVDRFCRLADAIQKPVTWILGPAELRQDDRFAAIEARTTDHTDRLIIPPDLATAADIIHRTALYIGNDAGMTHLAAALGVPTVAIFGPTDPNVWRPLGTHVHTVAPPQPAPIAEVTLDQVLDTVEELLDNI